MDDLRNLKGLLSLQKDNAWKGFRATFDRKHSKIYPDMVGPVNKGVALVLIDKEANEKTILRTKESLDLRSEKVIRRLKSMGKRGIKSLFTKGMRWAIDTAFGKLEDMNVTEFSGVFSFSDPTLISYEAFSVAEHGLTDFSDFDVGFWRLEMEKENEFEKNNSLIVSIMGGPGKLFNAVASKLRDTEYDSDEGRGIYTALGCIANYAWARRQVITGMVEASARDAFGKFTRVKKMCDVSFNIVFDNGEDLIYRKNFPQSHVIRLLKENRNILILKGEDEIGRMVPIDG